MVLDLLLIGLAITLEPFPLTAFILLLSLAAKLALGILLIGVAERQRRRIGRPRKPPTWMARLDRASPWTAAPLAAFLQPWALVAAGAATAIQAKLSTAGNYVTLLLFCVLATSSFLYLELYTVFAPAAAGARLVRLRTWLDTHRDQVIVIVFLLLGFWLAGKSIYLLVS